LKKDGEEKMEYERVRKTQEMRSLNFFFLFLKLFSNKFKRKASCVKKNQVKSK
jgi:hypothetical protein